MKMFEKAPELGPDPEIIAHVASGVPVGTSATEYALLHRGMLIRSKTGQDVVLDGDVVRQVLRLAGLGDVAAPALAARRPEPPPAVSLKPIPADRQAMTLAEAAKVIGCCKRTLERERDSGEIRCFRVGNRWRVSVPEISAYIRRREKAS
jgi:excisionase family DNA binding protein